MATYEYTISTAFTSNVNLDRFTEEIRNASAITKTLSYMTADYGTDKLSVVFAANLSNDEKTALDALVAAHSGLPIRELVSIAYDPPMEPVVPGASKVVANGRPAIEIQNGVTGWAAAAVVWPLDNFAAAQLRVCVNFILKESGTGTKVRICAQAKAEGPGSDSSEAFHDTAFTVVSVTHTTIGQVFEGEVWLDVDSFAKGDAVAIQAGRDGENTLGSGTSDDVSVPIQIISFCIKGR